MTEKKKVLVKKRTASSRFQATVSNEANKLIKHWTGLVIDPNSKKFVRDYRDISSVMSSVSSSIGSKELVKGIANELARKTVTGVVHELISYKELYLSEKELIDQWKSENLETWIKDIPISDTDSDPGTDSDSTIRAN